MNDQNVVEVMRDLAADPVSAALLLTSSSALEWWPGLRLEPGSAEGGALPATLTSGRQSELVGIEALPPQRTPTAFVARFRVSGGSYGTTDGAVTLARRADGTRATLRLASPRTDLEGSARRFLVKLAKVAETRSTAA